MIEPDEAGAVTSPAGRVTVVDFGEPVRVVCALPAVSVIEKPGETAVSVEVTATPSAIAVEVAVIVQTVAEVCTILVIAEMCVSVKSVPESVESVEQVMSSLPVTVNVIVAEVEVALVAARVTVGAVLSAAQPVVLITTAATDWSVFERVNEVAAVPPMSVIDPPFKESAEEVVAKSPEVSPQTTL
ncbi:MAG: hypothetical protein ACKOKA_01005 [Acidimicrobiaceae bacterium]